MKTKCIQLSALINDTLLKRYYSTNAGAAVSIVPRRRILSPLLGAHVMDRSSDCIQARNGKSARKNPSDLGHRFGVSPKLDYFYSTTKDCEMILLMQNNKNLKYSSKNF